MKTYLVGGAVRDEILGRESKDRDWVVVGATPEDMLAQGFKQVGADFPVFLHPESGEEYALARVERKTGDGYHGFTVQTKDVSIEDDLGRRDLTINSIAKDIETGEYVDPYGGLKDIEKKILRHTSDAFAEDPLRVIRLARFAARYTDFTLAMETTNLAENMVMAGELNQLPYERFWAELEKVVHEPGLFRFFVMIEYWGAFEAIDFFREIFGTQSIKPDYWGWLEQMCSLTAQAPKEKRLMLLAALMGKDVELKPAGASSDFMKLHGAIRFMQKGVGMNQNQRIDHAYALMKRVKPWGEGPLYDHLIRAAWMMEQTKSKPCFYSFELDTFREKVCAIKAESFASLEGKALGEAIDKARKLNLSMAL